jgi:hypothetical protein
MSRTAVLELALRVLSSWTENRYPDPEDLRVLRRCVPSADSNISFDDLACQVIHRELRNFPVPVWKEGLDVVG